MSQQKDRIQRANDRITAMVMVPLVAAAANVEFFPTVPFELFLIYFYASVVAVPILVVVVLYVVLGMIVHLAVPFFEYLSGK